MDTNSETTPKRGSWKSSFGFLAAAIGSAVGLGNFWRFPYVMGNNGGTWFLVLYVFFLLLLGIPVLLGEITIGRSTQKSPVAAYEKIQKGSGFIGVMSIVGPFILMTYFSIISGWGVKYLFDYILTGIPADYDAYVGGTLAGGTIEPIIWTAMFLLITLLCCMFGTKGIEKIAKIAMPTFFILLIIVILRAVTLPGAFGGIRFMFLNTQAFSLKTIPMALGQVFFSLSIASGVMITYGSYLNKESKLPKNAGMIAAFDTLAALMAGIAIFPTVYAMGIEPSEGIGLAFVTLPSVFDAMPLGRVFGLLFFFLIFIAAITSSIANVETCASFCIDSFKLSRRKALILICSSLFIISVPISLSLAENTFFSDKLIFGMNLFDIADYITGNILFPVGGLLTCIIIGWFWKPQSAVDEIESTPNYIFKLKKAWSVIMKFIAPPLILVVLITQFI